MPSDSDVETLADSRSRLGSFLTPGRPINAHVYATNQKRTMHNGDPFPFVICLIPAHNEQDSIQRTIESLYQQTRRPDEIIVVADNCTDDTIAIALATGASVVQTQNNSDGKAGALNQVMAQILPILDFDDCILVMDADTVLTQRFIEATVNMLFSKSRKPIAGVGGIFLADDDKWNLVRQLQTNEYVRYQRRLSRRHGRALVLTGTGTVFKAGVLREVQQARTDGKIPDFGGTKSVYDTSSLTEDNELTISVKELGYRVVSPRDCTVKTAMMPTLRSLYKQRRRWQRGALENLIAHRINRHTAPYAIRQLLTYLGVFFPPLYLITLAMAYARNEQIDVYQPLWITVAVVYICEQTFSVRKGGWKAVLVSLAVLPELFLNAFLNVVYLVSLFGAIFATDESWGRMRHLDSLANTNYREKDLMRVNSLHGTHAIRQSKKLRVLEVLVAVSAGLGLTLCFVIPYLNLQFAWNLVAIYVLIGFSATLMRLIPVPTF